MYALQQAMRAIRSNWIASIATITTMTLSLTILAGFSLTTLNLNQVLAELQSELEITVYLDDAADDQLIIDQIRSWPEVDERSIRYVPKAEGLAQLVTELPSLAQAAQLVENPLPDRIDLRLIDPALTGIVSRRLTTLPGVSGVEDGSTAVETFLAISDALRVVGSILIFILLASSLLAIINSIRAAITARRREIEVMRLVGATRGFIRAPFLIEGLLLGLISAAVSLALVVPGYFYVVGRLSSQLPFIPFVRDTSLLATIVGLLFALSVLVGLGGSAIAVSQHLGEEY